MGWSAEVYKGNLQDYIDQTRAHLLDIDAVGITLPLDIISYLVLGKLMHGDKLDKIIDNCAMSEDCTSSPYLVLDALQTWLTHKGSGYCSCFNLVANKRKVPIQNRSSLC
jgi:hypothetical protein